MLTAREHLVGVTEAREGFRELLEELQDRDVVILRHNRPVAMLVKPDRVENLVSRIEDLEDHLAILEGKLHPEATVSHAEAMAALGLDQDDEPRVAIG